MLGEGGSRVVMLGYPLSLLVGFNSPLLAFTMGGEGNAIHSHSEVRPSKVYFYGSWSTQNGLT